MEREPRVGTETPRPLAAGMFYKRPPNFISRIVFRTIIIWLRRLLQEKTSLTHNRFDWLEEKRHFFNVSVQEIIAELPKLNRTELEQVSLKLRELLSTLAAPGEVSRGLKQFAGGVRGLPCDMASNHDHHLHGRPKNEREGLTEAPILRSTTIG